MHVLLAAYVRTVAQMPGINRFLSGQKIYARDENIEVNLTVKKEMTATSPDTVIKVVFTPWDTPREVYEKLNAKIEEVKNPPLDSGFDNLAKLINAIPGVFLKFTIWFLKLLDYFGLLPRAITQLSPFHGSLFITSMGSLGIPPIFHHLYDFGNVPVFCAFGREVFADGAGRRRQPRAAQVHGLHLCDGRAHLRRVLFRLGFEEHPSAARAPGKDGQGAEQNRAGHRLRPLPAVFAGRHASK